MKNSERKSRRKELRARKNNFFLKGKVNKINGKMMKHKKKQKK